MKRQTTPATTLLFVIARLVSLTDAVCSLPTSMLRTKRTSALVVTEDTGFSAANIFAGPIPTPNPEGLAKSGLLYNQFRHGPELLHPFVAATRPQAPQHRFNGIDDADRLEMPREFVRSTHNSEQQMFRKNRTRIRTGEKLQTTQFKD